MEPTVTITLGWWVFPALVTACGVVHLVGREPDRSGPYGIGTGVGPLIFVGWLIASLVAWLIWALAT